MFRPTRRYSCPRQGLFTFLLGIARSWLLARTSLVAASCSRLAQLCIRCCVSGGLWRQGLAEPVRWAPCCCCRDVLNLQKRCKALAAEQNRRERGMFANMFEKMAKLQQSDNTGWEVGRACCCALQ